MTLFTFDGHSCREFGIVADGGNTWGTPEADVDSVVIPGRNGELTIDNKRFKNIIVPYRCGIVRDFAENAAAARAWLLSKRGYRRLTDSLHSGEFRLARFAGPVDFDMQFMNRAGETVLNFDCRPERFLTGGELTLELHQSGATIANPTDFTALPLITVHGTGAGTLNVGGVTVAISAIDDYVTLDCEAKEAYKGSLNKNSTITGHSFPALDPGNTTITWSGGVTYVEIIPRWWTV